MLNSAAAAAAAGAASPSQLLMAAMQALGLPPTDQFALPASLEYPLPEAWIWILRIREMWRTARSSGDVSSLERLAQGDFRVCTDHSAAATRAMAEELSASAAWYDKAMAETGMGGGEEEDGVAEGEDAALRRRFYSVAQRILAAARGQMATDQ